MKKENRPSAVGGPCGHRTDHVDDMPPRSGRNKYRVHDERPDQRRPCYPLVKAGMCTWTVSRMSARSFRCPARWSEMHGPRGAAEVLREPRRESVRSFFTLDHRGSARATGTQARVGCGTGKCRFVRMLVHDMAVVGINQWLIANHHRTISARLLRLITFPTPKGPHERDSRPPQAHSHRPSPHPARHRRIIAANRGSTPDRRLPTRSPKVRGLVHRAKPSG